MKSIKAIWKAVKPTDTKGVLMWVGAIAVVVILFPDLRNAYENEGHLTQQQIIDTEMTKRWMILPHDKTTAGHLTGPSGTKFLFRVYPDDSLLVSNGTTLKWLPSMKALAEIESKRPSHRWIIDILPFLGSISLVDTAYAGEPICKEGPKTQTGKTVFTWERWCPPDYEREVCELDTRTGLAACAPANQTYGLDSDQG